MGGALQLAAWCAAFQVMLAGFAAQEPGYAARLRMALGLALGALACRVGWALLHGPALASDPTLLWSPAAGFTLLGMPAGVLVAAPWRSGRAQLHRWLASAFGPLAFGLAIAKTGCLAAGCCGHPLGDAAAYAALGLATRGLPRRAIAPTLVVAVVGLRVILQPLRS
jgi:hypothetical protein